MHFNKYLSLVTFLLTPLLSLGQGTVTGRILTDTGEPLPFATVYEQGSTNGTTSNADGYYQLTLTPGQTAIIAQYIGYARQATPLSIVSGQEISLDFVLKPETLVLNEVVISANERDPARQVIRNAIKKRKYYKDEVSAFSCEVYIKGMQRLDKKPNSVLGMTVTVDTGIVYLSESISQLKYMRPDKINETIISSKVSGDNNAFSYNQASDMLINLYENTFFIEGLSERSFISPIAYNAFLYYDYKMAGTILENGLYINKVKITPKRKTDPVFSGYLYIIEGTWRIHSVDVALSKSNGIEFLDSLTFKQVFAPVGHDIWMPISQRFAFKFKVFGFEGSGHFTGIYRNYEVEPNYWQPRKANPSTEPATKPVTKGKQPTEQERRDPLFTKEDFSNAVLKVDEEANEKDSIYWATVRPIPLTQIEIQDYKVKDSIQVIKESKPYKDSLDEVRNRLKLGNLLFTGYTHFNSHKRRYVQFPTLFNGLQYNAVEGLVTNMEFAYTKRTKDALNYRIAPGIRYGFGNKTFQAKIEATKLLNPKKREYLTGGVGRYVFQYSDEDPISAFTNTTFTVVRGENYARLYQKYFLYVGYQSEVANGLFFDSKLTYESRETMSNHASYNLSGKDFAPNPPINSELANTEFSTHQALTLALKLRVRFAQKYIERPNRKIILSSKYPDLHLQYKKGIPLLGSSVNYDLIKIGANHKVRLWQFGESQLNAWTGMFVNSKKMYFPDFQHFNGNQTYLRQPAGDRLFQLLNYYLYSTRERFVQAHLEHHFNEFIFNKIPFAKHLNLQAVASANYLTTPALGHYYELGVGIEHIFKFMRIDFYTAFRNGENDGSGIRIGAGF